MQQLCENSYFHSEVGLICFFVVVVVFNNFNIYLVVLLEFLFVQVCLVQLSNLL